MPRARRVCPTPGCPELTDGGRCADCRAEAERRRGSAAQRGYDQRHTTRFRRAVLLANPTCVCAGGCCDRHHRGECMAPSTVADHYPRSRRELVAARLDANDPRYGRGTCAGCHNHSTSHAQPGGWNAR